jgi:hypothetical protein
MQTSVDREGEVDDSDIFRPLKTPQHPAFEAHLDEIELTRIYRGPSAAADVCIEILLVCNRLLELALDRDPETVELLGANRVTIEDLEHLGQWLKQRAREIALEIC